MAQCIPSFRQRLNYSFPALGNIGFAAYFAAYFVFAYQRIGQEPVYAQAFQSTHSPLLTPSILMLIY